MLGVLCARPKAWLFATLSLSSNHGGAASFHHRLIKSPFFKSLLLSPSDRRRHHSSPPLWPTIPGGALRILPPYDSDLIIGKGEGSWNAAWDARPARWSRNPHSAWLLFGFSPPPTIFVSIPNLDEQPVQTEEILGLVKCQEEQVRLDLTSQSNYKVRGVPADGRCLFRAIAHMACLRNGEEVPDENRQRELADELRAQVVDELLRRREEAEWFIEGDFDAYVKRIQQPYVWGGEPELIMASHVLKAPISVFMSDRSSGELTKIANYGEDYKKDDESPINVLFHGYGHYDILEIVDQSHQRLKLNTR